MTITRAFSALLYAQWKYQRAELALLAMLAAVIGPVAAWIAVSTDDQLPAWSLLEIAPAIGAMGAFIAALTGLALAIRPYWLDARSNHTYAMALPIRRDRYGTMRVATGLALTLIPAMGFLIGMLVTTQAAPPSSLRAFPVGLTLRFLLAAATAFAIGFGLQYGLGRRALRWFLIVALTIGAVEIFGQLTLHASLSAPLFELLAKPASPLAVFWDRWMLFDV